MQSMTWDGTLKDLPGLGRLDGAAARAGTAAPIPRPVHDDAEDDETPQAPSRRVSAKSGAGTFQWVVSEPGFDVRVGEVLGLPVGSLVGGERGIAKHPSGWIPVAKIPHGTASDYINEVKKLW